jgi:hypothetical protein
MLPEARVAAKGMTLDDDWRDSLAAVFEDARRSWQVWPGAPSPGLPLLKRRI